MFETKGSNYKSLSADSELNAAYDLLSQGEYNQCARKIKKKLPKLKNPVDIANFEILKYLLLQRTKKIKEKNELLKKLKEDFLTKKELYENESLSDYFKNILRNSNEDKAAYEIFKIQNKGRSFDNLTDKRQNEILKELTQNLEFGDAYSKLNTFLKTPGENSDFLKLMRYECIYYLYKNKKFSENMLKKFGTELVNKFDELKGEKGYFDILAQYLYALKNKEQFVDIFTNKKKPEDISNVPIEDIKLEIMFEDKKFNEILNELYLKIKNNPDEFIFNSYERIINIFFYYLKQNNAKLNMNELLQEKAEEAEKLSPLDKPETVFMEIFNLFEFIKQNHSKNFNSFKSTILGQLMLYHNSIVLSSSFPDEIHKKIVELINIGLERASLKQSFLFEIQKYFIYLNDSDRKEIIEKYSAKINLTNYEGLSLEKISDYIFYFKLFKLLNHFKDEKELSEFFNTLLNFYIISFEKVMKGTKPAKGERLVIDDIAILLNELYFENPSKFPNKSLAMLLYVDSVAHENSPFNYDNNAFLLKVYGEASLDINCLYVLKYMNLKGPQIDTVSYISFPYFKNYKVGINFLVDSMEKWNNENRKNSKKTLWKMFDGRNFWDSEEILEFLGLNLTSYYTYLLNFFDLSHKINDSYLLPKNEDEEDFLSDYYTELKMILDNFEVLEKNNQVTRNQDMLVTMHKYNGTNLAFFNNDFNKLTKNDNYDQDHFRFKIDSLNKENNCLYQNIPGYKNNFLKNTDIKAFNEYEDYTYFKLRALCILILNFIDDIPNLKIYSEKLADQAKNLNCQLLSLLSDLYKKVTEHCENMNIDNFTMDLDSILDIITKIKQQVLDSLLEKAKLLKYGNFSAIKKFLNQFDELKHFYLIQISCIVSKFLSCISKNKKDAAKYKAIKEKLNNGFKSPFINGLKEIEKIIDELIANVHKENTNEIEIELKNVNEQYKTHFTEKDIKSMKEEITKIDDFHKDIFKEVKDYLKKMVDFIKIKI